MPNRAARSRSSSRRVPWQSSPRPTSTWADSAGKPDVIVQTWRSCTSTTPGMRAASRRPTARVSMPSRRRLEQDRRRVAQDRPRAREHEHADEDADERVGLRATRSAMITSAATATPDRAERGRRERAGTPPRRSGSRPARGRGSTPAATFTAMPTSAIASIQPPSTSGGSREPLDRLVRRSRSRGRRGPRRSRAPRAPRRACSRRSAPASTAGRRARAAKSARASATLSESMCTASARSARLSVRTPPTTSTTVYAAVSARATTSARALADARVVFVVVAHRAVLPVWAYGGRRGRCRSPCRREAASRSSAPPRRAARRARRNVSPRRLARTRGCSPASSRGRTKVWWNPPHASARSTIATFSRSSRP